MVAIDLITEHIRGKLQQHDLRRIFHNLEVIPSNFQTRGMHTIVRCRYAARASHGGSTPHLCLMLATF